MRAAYVGLIEAVRVIRRASLVTSQAARASHREVDGFTHAVGGSRDRVFATREAEGDLTH
jgi:hypothetical protein